MRTRAAARLKPQAVLDDYLSSLQLRTASAAMARAVLPRFFAHLEELGVGDLRAVREEHLASYARQLRTVVGKRGRIATISTQRSFLGTVRGLFVYLEKRRLILRDPSRELVLPRAERLPGPVPSEAQVRRVIQAPFPGSRCGKRDRAILEILYGTGLRVSECVRLDVVDLDLAEGTLLVRNGKGKKDRVVPVAGRAALALDVYLNEARSGFRRSSQERALFLSTHGGRLTRSAIEARVRALQKAVRSPVGSRRTCCATPAPRIFLRAVPTSGTCRSCSGTNGSRRPPSTRGSTCRTSPKCCERPIRGSAAGDRITLLMLAPGTGIHEEGNEGGWLAAWRGSVAAEDPQVRDIHADGLGSIVAMTDAAGNVTSRRQYDAWGNLEVGADQPGYAFTGREWDPETELYYYRARYYDPKTRQIHLRGPDRVCGRGQLLRVCRQQSSQLC